jgi:hypothetical protein
VSELITSNDTIINELERSRKQAAVAYTETLSQNLPGRIEEECG